MVDSTTADDAQEFKEKWGGHINQIYKLGHSLPEEDVEEFMQTVEQIEEYLDLAAEHTFDEE